MAWSTLAAVLVMTSALGPATRGPDPDRWLDRLDFPVNMAWAPDGTLFYAEKESGRVRMVVDGELDPDPVATVEVRVSFETGLLGIAVHPAWPREPWLYLYSSDAADGRNRLIRVRIHGGEEVARETLLDALPTAAAYHNGGDLVFGADGMLYLSVGDAHEPDRAQDPTDLGGKVVRLTPEGAIPPDNPFDGSRIFTLGHRNSFGLCVDPATGELWETENGPSGGDEVNRLVAGANYGWPAGMGSLGDRRYTDPFASFPQTVVPTGCAVWRGALYVATYGDGVLRRLALDGGRAERVHAFDEPVYDLAVGPDDLPYASTRGAIWRFAEPPPRGTPDPSAQRGGSTASGVAWWVWPVIGVAVAGSLLATIRRSSRR